MTAEQTGLRIQEALDRLDGIDGPGGAGAAQQAGEQLVRDLMDFYHEGLTRIVTALPGPALTALLDDPAVAALLVLHELHPEDTAARIHRALAALPEPVELTGFDPATGTARLRRTRAGCGCSEEDIEAAVACHAPEVTAAVFERAPQLLQIATRPDTPAEAAR
ncbi:thioredoxin [Kitasatospora sp. NPDC057500]|uniref:thioredoxin n=1 Tax=Kitasatospora sp. NPDC057500 TaxID=3346151 RepID=UPI0036C655B2